jgi:PAS domain S-box-containing protein
MRVLPYNHRGSGVSSRKQNGWCWTLSFLLLLATLPNAAAITASRPGPKRVLILYSFESEIGLFSDFDQSLRATLKSGLIGPVEFHTEFLDLARFPGAPHERELQKFLRAKYSTENLDLVIPVSLPAIRFIIDHGEKLFPHTPVVFCAVDRRWLLRLPLPPAMTGVDETTKLTKTLAAALQLQPDARRVVVVGGTLPYERDWMKEIRADLRDYQGKLEFSYLTDLPLDELLKTLANLPEHTIVLYMMMWRDGAGEFFLPEEALSRIVQSSRAPVYSVFERYLGSGIVGGELVPFKTAGTVGGMMGLHVLAGEKPAEIPILSEENGRYMFDWRQLRRWHISERRLPQGSTVLFKEPAFWELYRRQIIEAFLLIIVETVLIALLLVQRSRRQRTQEALNASEERYRSLVESSHDWVWEVDSQGIFTYVGPQCRAILGYEPKELTGKKLVDLMPPDEARLVGRAFASIAAERQRFRGLESTNLHKSGRLVVLETNGVPIFSEDGSFRGYRGMDRDITERKQVQQRLEEYERLVESSQDMIAVVDRQYRYLLANHVYLEHVGMERGQVISHHMPEVLGNESFERVVKKKLDECFEGKAVQFERKHHSPQLGERDLLVSYTPIRSDGVIHRAACVLRDITERRQAEEALRKAEQDYRNIFEEALEGIYRTSPEGKNLAANPALARMLGYSSADEVVSSIVDSGNQVWVDPKDRLEYVKLLEEREIIRGFECRYKRKDGTHIWVSLSSRRVRGPEGKTLYYEGFIEDITERKRAESALRQQAAFDELMTGVLSRFATCSSAEVDVNVEKALQTIAEFAGADHAFVILWSADRTSSSATHEWCGPDVPPKILQNQSMPMGTIPRNEEWLLGGGVIRVNSRDDYPPEAIEERRFQEVEGHFAALTVPIRIKTGIIGCVGLHSHARPVVWSDDNVSQLRMVGDAVATALERKQFLEDLRKSEEKFSKAFHSSPVAMNILSFATGRYIDANKAYEQNTGYQSGEIIGRTPEELGIFVDHVDLERLRQVPVTQGGLHSQETQYKTKAGEIRVALLSTEMIEFGGGPCLLRVFEDVTERKRVEKTLREIGVRMLMAQEEERRRVSRDLHDDFSQRLALLAIDLEELSQKPPPSKRAWAERFQSMWSQVQELTTDIHRLSRQLHPSKLEDIGLVMALRSYCHEIARQAKITIEFLDEDVPRVLPREISLCLYRIVQESLRNVVKHSGAKTAVVELTGAPGAIRLTVSDSGKGFDVDSARQAEGIGLVSMRERARYVGGEFSICCPPAGGTRVEVRIPVEIRTHKAAVTVGESG